MLLVAIGASSPNVRMCSSPSYLQLPLRSFTTTWKQHAAVRVGRKPLTVAVAQGMKWKKKRQPQKKIKKPNLLAEDVVPDPGYGDLQDGQAGDLQNDNLKNGQALVNDEVGDEDDVDIEQNDHIKRAQLKEKLSQILSNAQRLKMGLSRYTACHTLGIDLGDARTGVAISKGFAPRPLEVVELQGPKLNARLMEIAHRERAVEFVVGLPKSSKGLETLQSHKARSFAGRLAVLAAQKGWCVYLHDEFGSSCDAIDYMLMMGSTRKTRRTRLDAYAAVVLLQAYFDSSGEHAELVVPKKLSLQESLCEAPVVLESDDDDGDFDDESS